MTENEGYWKSHEWTGNFAFGFSPYELSRINWKWVTDSIRFKELLWSIDKSIISWYERNIRKLLLIRSFNNNTKVLLYRMEYNLIFCTPVGHTRSRRAACTGRVWESGLYKDLLHTRLPLIKRSVELVHVFNRDTMSENAIGKITIRVLHSTLTDREPTM